MRRAPSLLALLVVVAAEVGAIVALQRLGQLPWLQMDVARPLRWLAVTPPEDAVIAVVRVAATAVAWWLLATTVLYATTARQGTRGAGRVAIRTTPRIVRAIVDRALAASVATVVATSTLAVPIASGVARAALAAVPPPPAVTVPTHEATDGPAPPGTRPPMRGAGTAAATHTVQSGEHLWSIAAAATQQRPRRVTRYWWRLVTANRDRVRSDDPDLIYPGERIVLPRPVSRR